MKILFNIKAKVDKVHFMKLSPSERREFVLLEDRIESLFSLRFFLNLRPKIRKVVQLHYNSGIYPTVVEYDEYGFVEFEGVLVYSGDLEPLIREYIRKVEKEIESNNLKLTL